jgi:hypothetical protein
MLTVCFCRACLMIKESCDFCNIYFEIHVMDIVCATFEVYRTVYC